jgi:Zn-dependent oligopeptidase
MLENWTWDRAILKRLSKHHETGEELPDELIDAKLA